MNEHDSRGRRFVLPTSTVLVQILTLIVFTSFSKPSVKCGILLYPPPTTTASLT